MATTVAVVAAVVAATGTRESEAIAVASERTSPLLIAGRHAILPLRSASLPHIFHFTSSYSSPRRRGPSERCYRLIIRKVIEGSSVALNLSDTSVGKARDPIALLSLSFSFPLVYHVPSPTLISRCEKRGKEDVSSV